MTRVLVTGASSAYGHALARRLLEAGRQVRVLARPGRDGERLADEDFEVAPADLRDHRAIDMAVRDCEMVFHVATLFRSEARDDRELFDINIWGTRTLLDAAARHGVRRFIHVSTVGVHGPIAHPPANEDHPLLPDDPYRRSKLDGELLARAYFERRLAGTVVRPTAIYGPGDLRLLELFRSVQSGRFTMLGRGEVYHHLVYIDDLVAGTLSCAEQPGAVGEVFILGGPEAVRIGRLVELIAEVLERRPPRWRLPLAPVRIAARVCQTICRAIGVAPPLDPRRLDFFTDNRSFDISKARRLLGFEPSVRLVEGLARTRDWYRSRGLLR